MAQSYKTMKGVGFWPGQRARQTVSVTNCYCYSLLDSELLSR